MITSSIAGKRIVLAVTGSIAAYKAVSLLRIFVQQGAEVFVVMTESATRFVAPLTFEVLSHNPVVTNVFSGGQEMLHLTLPEKADIFIIAPCTANSLAKCALGLADDLLNTMLLTIKCPLIIAPAMDGDMWQHPAVVSHVQVLRERGVTVLDPECGLLASGQWGQGRMPSEEVIISAMHDKLAVSKDWLGHRFLISAGPTREPIDAVRFLSNGASGKMGYALAQAAIERGAEVALVSGPTDLEPPSGVGLVSVVTAEEMYQALIARFESSTVLIMAAAVGDFRPRRVSTEKVKKHEWTGQPLEMERTTDILAALSARRTQQLLVGFAAETSDLIKNGQDKLKNKCLDMVVVNQIGGKDSAFGNETNEAILLTRDGQNVQLPRMYKRALADRILDELHTIKLPISKTPHPGLL